MKSEIVSDLPYKKERPFPKLMINKEDTLEDTLVVLFTNRDSGTVIYCCSSQYPLGYRGDVWNNNNFTDFEGTLQLSNDQ